MMNKNKIMASLLALVMMLSVFAPSFAYATVGIVREKTKVVVHKMHQESLEDVSEKAKQNGYNGGEIKPQDYTKIFGNNSKELENVKFIVYKVTDADTIKTLKESPNSYDTEEKLKTLVAENKLTDKKEETTKGNNAGATFILDEGSYWFIEDQTTVRDGNKVFAGAVAVPFLLELPVYKQNGDKFSETDALHVYPKNTTNAPKIDKNFVKTHGLEAAQGWDKADLLKAGADIANYDKEKATVSAEIGKEIPYEVVTKIPAKSLYKRLVWQDSMTKGLIYKKDLEIKYGESADTANTKLETPADYKIEQNDSGFILTLEKAGIEKLEKAAADKDIYVKLTYHATVNSKAVVDQPDKNNISFDYNNKPGENTDPREKTVKGTEVKVEKTWADGSSNQAPADAKVTYYLYKKGSTFAEDVLVDSVIKTASSEGGFNHTFSNLENGDYYVKEFVQGYTPEYTLGEEGTIKLKNDKKPGTPLVPKTPEIVTGGKKFVKTNDKAGNELKRLAGAEFVIQNKNTNDSTNNGKYLKINDSKGEGSEYLKAETAYQEFIKKVNEALAKGEISAENKVDAFESDKAIKGEVDRLEKDRNEAFVKANLNYTWVDDTEDATKFYSNDRGQFEVKGLAYGDYQAVETAAPKGYALPTGGGSFTFKVEKGSYTSEENGINYELDKQDVRDAKQIKNNKVSIPQTGGIGTVIFTVAGLAIMGGAFYAMKKRNEEQEEA